MLNFGLTELRLVTPRDGWPNPDAGPAAAGADIVLAEAKVFDSLAEAVADCTHHLRHHRAQARRDEAGARPPKPRRARYMPMRGRSAYIFGAERSGLDTDDVALAHAIVTVPINPKFASLNLAQAVILLAYEWSKHAPSEAEGGVALASPPTVATRPRRAACRTGRADPASGPRPRRQRLFRPARTDRSDAAHAAHRAHQNRLVAQ